MKVGRIMEANGEERIPSQAETLEREVWRCLNSVDHLLRRREVLHQTLRQGWMELVSARYGMGAARVSHSLLSMTPQAGKAVVDISLHLAGKETAAISNLRGCGEESSTHGPVVFDLVKTSPGRRYKAAGNAKTEPSDFGNTEAKSRLRRRPVARFSDDTEQLLEDSNLINHSDSEDEMTPLEVQEDSLQGFGTIVSPHLRSAQATFFRALEVAVELLNAQSELLEARTKVSTLRASMTISTEDARP